MNWVAANIFVVCVAYAAASLAYLTYVLRPSNRAVTRSWRVLLGAWALHGVAVVHLVAAVHAGSARVGTAVVLTVAFVLAGLFMLATRRGRGREFGVFIAPLLCMGTLGAWAGVAGPRPPPRHVMDALLRVHIATSALGLVGFLVAFVASALYLAQDIQLRSKRLPARSSKWPPQARLDRWATRAVVGGFPIYTLGLLLGTVWALRKGTGHLFTPQYVFSVVAWCVFAALLYGRTAGGWRGRKAAVATTLGFFLTLAVVVVYAARGGA